MEKIALLPGGFKPPHAGHYNMAKWLASNTDANTVVIKVGAKERDGITRDISLQLWDLYRSTDPDPLANKLTILPSTSNSPVSDVYDFIEQEAPEGSTIYLGMGEKDMGDARFKNIGKFADPKNIIFKTTLVPPQAGGVSGTKMREFIKNDDKKSFQQYIPEFLTNEQKDKAWELVVGLNEDLYNPRDKYFDFAKSSEWKAGLPDGHKEDIPRAYKYKRGGMYNAASGQGGAGTMYESGATMNKQETAEHNKNLKLLKKYLNKQGNQYTEVPPYVKGTHSIKLYEEDNYTNSITPGTITTSAALINNKIISLEVMNTPEKQMEGMMGRSELKGGLIFPLNVVQRRDFHMENCKIPLDIMFLKNSKISKIHHECPPCQESPCQKYSAMADDVIELPGGYCNKHNIQEGDEITLNLTENIDIKPLLSELEDYEIRFFAMHADILKQLNTPNFKIKYQELSQQLKGERLEALEYFYNEYLSKLDDNCEIEEDRKYGAHDALSQHKDKISSDYGHTKYRDLQLMISKKEDEKVNNWLKLKGYITKKNENFPPYKANQVQQTRYKASDVFTRDIKKAEKMGYKENVFTKDWWSNIINEHILTEGGAAGHMAHPFNLPNVNSGKDLKDLFIKSANSLQSNPGSVKIDGVNSSIRLVDLEGRKQFVMDRGSKKPLDIKGITKSDLEDRFKPGHGMVKVGGEVLDMFNEALPSLEADLKKLGAWEDPNILFNMEYVSGKTNVQDYESNFIAVHGLNKVESKEVQGKRGPLIKRASTEIPYDKLALQSMLDNLLPIAKKNGFEVYGSVPTEMKSKPNFGAALSKNYTIKYDEGDKTQSLDKWLGELINIPEEDFIFMNVNGIKKKVGAVSKQVYVTLLKGDNIDELYESEEDKQKAIEGFTTYLATEKLGDEILKILDSPMGTVDNHEGVVIRDEKIANVPFKITGKFILGGMVSDF